MQSILKTTGVLGEQMQQEKLDFRATRGSSGSLELTVPLGRQEAEVTGAAPLLESRVWSVSEKGRD